MRDPPPLLSPFPCLILHLCTQHAWGGGGGRPAVPDAPSGRPASPPREVVDATHFTIFIQAKHV